ncbi:MAG: hypothetical protein COA58_08085 [Bacteroidetes bacterium]|nr:MAG: hypothetical protein COA58_08085 [Bacteroidota bacterium]
MDPLLSLIVGFVFGLLFFFFDLNGGKKWYRRWHNLSNKNPLNEDSNQGFVHQQPFSKKLVPAVFIFVLFSFILWYTGNLNPIEILISGGILLFALMLAFHLGPLLLNILPAKMKQVNKAIEKIDELEANIKSEKIEVQEVTPEKIEVEKPKETPKPKAKEAEPKKDWRDGVQDFLDK